MNLKLKRTNMENLVINSILKLLRVLIGLEMLPFFLPGNTYSANLLTLPSISLNVTSQVANVNGSLFISV